MEKFIQNTLASLTAVITCVAPIALLSQNAHAFEPTHKVSCFGTGFNDEPIIVEAKYSNNPEEPFSGTMALLIDGNLNLYTDVLVQSQQNADLSTRVDFITGNHKYTYNLHIFSESPIGKPMGNAYVHLATTRVTHNLDCYVAQVPN